MSRTTTAICAALGAAIVFALLAFTLLPDEKAKDATYAATAEGVAHQTACRSWLLAVSSNGLTGQIDKVRADYYDPTRAADVMLQAKSALMEADVTPQLDSATFEAFRSVISPLDSLRTSLGHYSSAATLARSSALAHLDDALSHVESNCSDA